MVYWVDFSQGFRTVAYMPQENPSASPRPFHLRILANLAGFTLLIGGALMLVLPGPGVASIAGGLAILAKEYPWARRLLLRAKLFLRTLKKRFFSS